MDEMILSRSGTDEALNMPKPRVRHDLVAPAAFHLNVMCDPAALTAQASFRAGIRRSIEVLADTITDNVTLNLKIDWSGTDACLDEGAKEKGIR